METKEGRNVIFKCVLNRIMSKGLNLQIFHIDRWLTKLSAADSDMLIIS